MAPATSTPPPATPPAAASKRSLLGALLHWARDLLFSVVLAVIVILFLYQPVKVEGTSMMPTLDDQERIFINKFVYHFSTIDRGDTIVFWFPGDPTKSYIKRVIGVPGDTVEVDRGTVVVNGHALEEDYVPSEYRDDNSMPAKKMPVRRILRPGRSPQFVERQPRLGPGAAPVYLRQSGVHLLAVRQNGRTKIGRESAQCAWYCLP